MDKDLFEDQYIHLYLADLVQYIEDNKKIAKKAIELARKKLKLNRNKRYIEAYKQLMLLYIILDDYDLESIC